MNETEVILKPNTPQMGLSQEMEASLSTWEDHLSILSHLAESTAGLSWIKSDIIAHMVTTFGESSIAKIALDLNEPASTISAYSRVSKAFPQDKRNPMVSFSHHLQASFADSYSEVDKKFVGEERFDWVNKAEDERFSTRRLRAEIKDKKIESAPKWVEKKKCDHCHLNVDNIEKYVIFQPEKRGTSKTFMLDHFCYTEIIDYIEAKNG